MRYTSSLLAFAILVAFVVSFVSAGQGKRNSRLSRSRVQNPKVGLVARPRVYEAQEQDSSSRGHTLNDEVLNRLAKAVVDEGLMDQVNAINSYYAAIADKAPLSVSPQVEVKETIEVEPSTVTDELPLYSDVGEITANEQKAIEEIQQNAANVFGDDLSRTVPIQAEIEAEIADDDDIVELKEFSVIEDTVQGTARNGKKKSWWKW